MSEEPLGFYWDGGEPLKKLETETNSSSQALFDYAHMGFSRSLRALHEKYLGDESAPTQSYPTICGWSKRYDWQDRVRAWEELEKDRQDKVWRERKNELRKKEWDNFDKLQSIISELLDNMPSFVSRKEKVTKGSAEVVDAQGKVIHKGVPDQKVIILGFDVNAAVKFIRTASDIGRRAAEMDGNVSANLLKDIDFSKLTPEQIEKVAEGEDILEVLGVKKT